MDAAMVEPELLDEVQPDIQDYEEKDKPTTVALIEFLNSELRWEYDKPLDEDEESTV
jgi:DNA-directed RNA polymerase subunit K/omega